MRDTPLNVWFFAPLIALLGVVMVVRTLVAGGGPLSSGVILGLLFVVLGALRMYGGLRRG